jgi:hypothetical protein
MTELRNTSCNTCPTSCPCPVVLDIATSIAHEEDALACIMNAECAKINKAISFSGDIDALLSVNESVRETLAQISDIETTLKAKLDSILPLIKECN